MEGLRTEIVSESTPTFLSYKKTVSDEKRKEKE